MKKLRLLTVFTLILSVFLLNIQPVLAFPPIPSGFYGTVKINGANVPAGTLILAKINGVTYATTPVLTYNEDTVYSLDVPGDDADTPGAIEGGVAGDTVVFFIGAIQATQTAAWSGGNNVPLNLTGTNQAPVITEGDSVGVGMTTTFDLTLHATDANSDTLTWSIKTQAGHGTAAASGTGTSKVIGYTPTSGYQGSDSFVVEVSDGNGGTDTITVNVTVSPLPANSPPVIAEGDSVSVTMLGVFNLTLHATDADSDTLTAGERENPGGQWHCFCRQHGLIHGHQLRSCRQFLRRRQLHRPGFGWARKYRLDHGERHRQSRLVLADGRKMTNNR